jgi:hypothetical protein
MSMSSMSEDRGSDRGGAPGRTIGVGVDRRIPATSAPVDTVYDAIRELLIGNGWVQGRQIHRERLSLPAAIDVVVGVDLETRAAAGPHLARSGRVRRHLCELAGIANLVAWNDDRARNLSDVIDLLTFAAVAYPDD